MPRTIDHDQRRQEIIAAAWRLIVDRGLEAATMRELAAEAGFANGALKHYFPGKDEIIAGAYQHALRLISDRGRGQAGDQSGLGALRAACWAALPLDDEATGAAGVLLSFWERGQSNAELRALYDQHLAAWRADLGGLIAQARAEGDITTATPDGQLVDEIITLTVGATLLRVVAPEFTPPAAVEALLDGFFARLA
jgi:AcrR family transcriptional regulator